MLPARDDDDAPLRVLAITGNAIVGGMESAVLRLAENLPARSFRLTALCPFESAFTAALRRRDVAVHVAPISETLRWHAVQFAAQLVRERDIDVVHTHMPAAHAIGALAARITRTPILATIHAMHLSMRDLEVHRLARTHLCVVSEAARAHALSVGVDPAHLAMIRNGVDGKRFTPREMYTRDGDAVVGYVGRLSPEKNPALFLKTAALVLARLPRTRFVVIGDGPLRGELEALAVRLRIRHAVAFEGECDDMPACYRGLDMLLLTSWHEGTPLAVLEAMACGLPVVATDVGGVAEIVVSGATGWLAAPDDDAALAERTITLLQSRVVMRGFGEAARTRALTTFSLDEQVRRTGALLRALAQADGRRPSRPASRPTLACDRDVAAAS